MSERQKTGVWFIITGLLLLSLWFFAYSIVSWSIVSGYAALNADIFTSEHKYILGASAVVSLQFISLTGIPFLLTGLAQVIVGMNRFKK